MVPHFVFLPRILLPFTWYSWSLPTTANGIISCWERTDAEVSDGAFYGPADGVGRWWRLAAYPDFVIDRSVLRVLVKLFLRVNVDPVGS